MRIFENLGNIDRNPVDFLRSVRVGEAVTIYMPANLVSVTFEEPGGSAGLLDQVQQRAIGFQPPQRDG